MVQDDRLEILNDLAAVLVDFQAGSLVRIAIDGRTASGKTTLADELASLIGKRGRPVIRTSIDGFHRPKVERYARGRQSPQGYYFDARDLPAIVDLLLKPLGPGGNRLYRTASFDLDSDRPIQQEPLTAPGDAILIVDGTFLQRPELQGGWDLAIFVETSEQLSESRGITRDAGRLGGGEIARRLYAERYRPAFAIYQHLCAPALTADIVIDNEAFHRPDVRFAPNGRASKDLLP